MSVHHEPAQSVVQAFRSDVKNGLDGRQVQENRQRYGENKLKEKKKKTNLQKFAEQFKDVMILILIAAAVISFVIACIEGKPEEFFEPVLILLIVVLNAVMGVLQESKAEKAMDALNNLSAPLGDRSNMVFSGCSITYGTATTVVTATEMDTEMGKIAGLLEDETSTQTPLQKKLAQLGKYLGILAIAACAVVFAVGLINGIPAMQIFMTSVSLAVSAIPEGLPAIVTIVLSIGVQRMVKKNAIIRRLPAVETLGGASVICSDKTGTLTQNRMTLVKAWVNDEPDTEAISGGSSPVVKKLLQYGTLCCDGSVVFHDGEAEHIGDPTETAIILAAHQNGFPQAELKERFPRLGEIPPPFDSDRKLMTSINQIDGKHVVIVKGAFDVMASRCTKGSLAQAARINEAMSKDALRVLAVGCKEIAQVPEELKAEELESGLTLMGLLGMIDPRARKQRKRWQHAAKRASSQ